MFTLRINNMKKILEELKEEHILDEVLEEKFKDSDCELYVVDLQKGVNKND